MPRVPKELCPRCNRVRLFSQRALGHDDFFWLICPECSGSYASYREGDAEVVWHAEWRAVIATRDNPPTHNARPALEVKVVPRKKRKPRKACTNCSTRRGNKKCTDRLCARCGLSLRCTCWYHKAPIPVRIELRAPQVGRTRQAREQNDDKPDAIEGDDDHDAGPREARDDDDHESDSAECSDDAAAGPSHGAAFPDLHAPSARVRPWPPLLAADWDTGFSIFEISRQRGWDVHPAFKRAFPGHAYDQLPFERDLLLWQHGDITQHSLATFTFTRDLLAHCLMAQQARAT